MEPTPHVLVVEDDQEISALVARFLRSNAVRVSTASDGRDMDRALKDTSIDLIVLDLMLPGEDGLLCPAAAVNVVLSAHHHAYRKGRRS